jgi:hypothetical protein
MSCCDRLAIPEPLLRADQEEKSDPSNGLAEFEDDIAILRSLSFIAPMADKQA